MLKSMRKLGDDVLGETPWGTHFCVFYETRDDLLEILVPFLEAGLVSDELCLCVYNHPLTESDAIDESHAIDALRLAVPDLDRHLANDRLKMIAAQEWYFSGSRLDLERAVAGWDEMLELALARALDGLRLIAPTAWLEANDWASFIDYEKRVNESIANKRMILLCMYPLDRCGPGEILDVVQSHQFSVVRRHGSWAVLRNEALDAARAAIVRLVEERNHLRGEIREALAFGEIVGRSPALRTILRQVELVAPTDATVLILGESGTGKELIASAIHERSARREGPLVRVNCAAIPPELFESEFFGHIRGAFTGAVRDRVGRFQLADGGTLVLDEVAEIPLALQAKLLRVLQEGHYERVGEDVTRTTDVRVIASTNRSLRREIERGRFRPDLYYRLSVFPIEIPPLRERKEDIAPLAAHLLRQASQRLNRPASPLTQAELELLEQYEWRGNVRELAHVIERALILSTGGRLRLDLALAQPGAAGSTRRAGSTEPPPRGPSSPVLTDAEFRRRERDNIRRALERAGGKIYGRDGAATLLGIKPTTLASRMKALGIKRPRG